MLSAVFFFFFFSSSFFFCFFLLLFSSSFFFSFPVLMCNCGFFPLPFIAFKRAIFRMYKSAISHAMDFSPKYYSVACVAKQSVNDSAFGSYHFTAYIGHPLGQLIEVTILPCLIKNFPKMSGSFLKFSRTFLYLPREALQPIKNQRLGRYIRYLQHSYCLFFSINCSGRASKNYVLDRFPE